MHAKTRLEKAFGNRERVVKLGFAGKVAHTKIVEPIEWAGAAISTYDNFDAQFAGVHEASIARPE